MATTDYRAIDLVALPFMPEVRDTIYARNDVLREGFERSAMWHKTYTSPQLLASMDAARIEKILISANTGGEWAVPYELVAEFVQTEPGRFCGMAGVDPRDIVGGVKRLKRAVNEYGFVGAHSYPHWFGLSPADRAYYPFYAACCELDVPVQVQVGKAWQRQLVNTGHPAAFDTIAVSFPELRLIGIHIGYPWEREMIAVAAKHPNVFIGADGHHPDDWSADLLDYLKVSWKDPMMDGRNKVLWGTNYPALDFSEALAAVERLGLEPSTQRRLLYENVKQVYRL